MVECERGLRSAGFANHVGGLVAEWRVGMHLLHQAREISGSIELPHGLVKRYERVLDRAMSLNGRYLVDRTLSSANSVFNCLFKGGDIGLGSPNRRLG